ncbi:MFS monocarboxylate transporter [Paramyrothecium foliicola]|nr:MFS monocarboxylate transporter [Paramyrothecium foliicola]
MAHHDRFLGMPREREAVHPMGSSRTSEESAPRLDTIHETEKNENSSNTDGSTDIISNHDDVPAISTSKSDPGPPPDGGLRAWIQVLANHLIVFNCWGFTISFGIFQPYYEQELSMPASTISWVGSIQICLIYLVGTFSGRAFDAGYFWATIIIGSLLQLIGIFMTSVSTQYWQFLLAQGVCQGLGAGIVFTPVVANTSTYFVKKRVTAISLAASGAATGGIVFPVMAQNLLPKIGFQWTLRAIGLVVLTNTAIVLAVVKTRLPGRKSGPILELSAFKETPYSLFAIGMWFTVWATYFTYYYARSYALSVLSAPQSTSFTALLILNGAGIPGRIVPAYLADRYFGAVNVFIPTIFSVGVLTFAWAGVRSLAANYAWVAIVGYFAAGIQSLFPATCASLNEDMSKNGTRMGMLFTLVSVAALTGPPLAGKLIQVAGGSYIGAQVWGGSCLMLGAGFMVGVKLAIARKKQ